MFNLQPSQEFLEFSPRFSHGGLSIRDNLGLFMAKLQKRKSVADKFKKKDGEASTAVSGKLETEPSSTLASTQISSKNLFKNVKTMTAQTIAEGELNFFQRGVQFLKEVQAELGKVTWPNRKQIAGSTVVVIVLVFIIAAFLGFVDVALSKLVQVVLA